MFFRMVYKSGQIFLPFCHNSRMWRTDRRTDRRTDGRTEISSQYRVCITCSAVKINPRCTNQNCTNKQLMDECHQNIFSICIKYRLHGLRRLIVNRYWHFHWKILLWPLPFTFWPH